MPKDRGQRNNNGASKLPRKPVPKLPRKPVARIFSWRNFDPSMVASDGRPSLVEELITYRDCLSELLEREGAYVVIKGKEYKILDDRESALCYAVENYGSVPVLVKKIVAKEPVHGLGGASL
jgi:hypothetical protein